ncbi:hypothetical protein X474_03430 [Dethiosulfatarculus sandiegensis]|uniref:Uncharacterized protein n=1 Tax=Dethiosulfatarculus sandiegensis TaxID=1429043 RepID=A0A0D2HYK7_9BACT|nr:hypothetical protein X474_03430 [Dethiosulfatarculus sandiegensis]
MIIQKTALKSGVAILLFAKTGKVLFFLLIFFMSLSRADLFRW